MKSMRMALLAAAALAVTPAAAWADRQNQPDQNNGGGHADHGDRGNHGGGGGGDHPRPAPPQGGGGHGSGMMVMPGSTPNGYRPPQPPQPQPQQNRGGGGRDNWTMPSGPDHVRMPPPGNVDTGQARAQWRQGGNGQPYAQPGPDRRDDNHRGQWNVGGRPGGDDRGGNDNHASWSAGANGGQWDRGPGRDGHRPPDVGNDHDQRRWDNGNRTQWNNDHSWNGRPNPGGPWNGNRGDNGRPGANNGRWDHHWDPGHWRNDHRYDWRDWRNSHRSVFNRHYYAPRGYRYRSVYAGFFLQPFFYSSSYWLDDPYDDYRLPPVEWPLRWVHYYNDALLVDVTTGEVVDVIPNFFF